MLIAPLYLLCYHNWALYKGRFVEVLQGDRQGRPYYTWRGSRSHFP